MPKKGGANPYDTIFNFVFAPKKKSKKPPKPSEPIASASELGEAFAQIALNPAIYLVEKGMADLSAEISGLAGYQAKPLPAHAYYVARRGRYISRIKGGKVEYEPMTEAEAYGTDEAKIKVGLGNLGGFIANPRGYIDAVFKQYRKDKLWNAIGGGTRAVDAAIMGLMGRRAGLDWAEALNLFPHASERGFAERINRQTLGSRLRAERMQREHGVGSGLVESAFKESSFYGDLTRRKAQMAALLRSGGVTGTTADAIASEFWDDHKDKTSGEKIYSLADKGNDKLDELAGAYQYELYAKLQALQASAADPKAREAARVLEARLRGYLGGATGFSPGALVGKSLFFGRWLKDQVDGDFLKGLLTGSLFGDYWYGLTWQENKGFKVEGGSASDDFWLVKTKANTVVRRSSDTLPGKLLGWLYYFHPVNFVKGVLWDGRLWGYLALKRNIDPKTGAVSWVFNKKSPFYAIFKYAPKNLFSAPINYAINFLADRFKKALWYPIRDTFINLFKKLLGPKAWAKLINMLPAVGQVMSIVFFVLSPILEPILQFFVEFIVLIVFGFFSLIILSATGIGGMFGGDDGGMAYFQKDMNPPITDATGVGTAEAVGLGFKPVYSGNASQIFDAVARELRVTSRLMQVDCEGGGCNTVPCRSICGAQNSNGGSCDCPSGAWCYSAGSTIFCRGNKLATVSSAVLTRLFRHELTHTRQGAYAGTWPNWGSQERVNTTEWGADHVSENGGGYCFYTRDGYISGTMVSRNLISKYGCSSSLLDQAAIGDYSAITALENSSCHISPRRYITGRTIGGSCGR